MTDAKKQNSLYRFLELDILKTLAIISIILAHSVLFKDPEIDKTAFYFNQFRNFEVVMLVWISAGLGFISIFKKELNFWAYFKKRIFRLILPVWLFYGFFYFFYNWYYETLNPAIFDDNFPDFFLGVFTFGILGYPHYIWVIRVFLVTSILTYLIHFLSKRIKFFWIFGIQLGSFLILNYFYFFNPSKINFILKNDWLKSIGIEIISYGLVISHGYFLYQDLKAKDSKKTLFLFILGVFYLALFFVLNYLKLGSIDLRIIQENKYPPVFFYILYGLAMSFFVYSLLSFLIKLTVFLRNYLKSKLKNLNSKLSQSTILNNILNFTKIIFNKFISIIHWISGATLSIYLWHVFSITFLRTKYFQTEIIKFLPEWEFEKWDELFINYLVFAFAIAILETIILKSLKMSKPYLMSILKKKNEI